MRLLSLILSQDDFLGKVDPFVQITLLNPDDPDSEPVLLLSPPARALPLPTSLSSPAPPSLPLRLISLARDTAPSHLLSSLVALLLHVIAPTGPELHFSPDLEPGQLALVPTHTAAAEDSSSSTDPRYLLTCPLPPPGVAKDFYHFFQLRPQLERGR